MAVEADYPQVVVVAVVVDCREAVVALAAHWAVPVADTVGPVAVAVVANDVFAAVVVGPCELAPEWFAGPYCGH